MLWSYAIVLKMICCSIDQCNVFESTVLYCTIDRLEDYLFDVVERFCNSVVFSVFFDSNRSSGPHKNICS